jgi:hypothetical protein
MSTFNNVFNSALRGHTGRHADISSQPGDLQKLLVYNEMLLTRVETMMSEINSKLELILDTMTKPAQQSGPAVSVETKSEEPQSNEPKRMLGPSAQMQIVRYIEQQPGGTAVFKKLASAGFVSARIRTKPPGCPPSHRYTHTVIIRNSASGLPKFEPTIFGIDEAREVAAYLESLGVKVNSKALNRA